MSASAREEQQKMYATQAARRLVRAGETLARRQVTRGPGKGNVPPWAGCPDPDFHGTLQAIWVWSRSHVRNGDERFASAIVGGWSFIESQWRKFVPTSLGEGASDEAAYDCAMVLRAALASRATAGGDALRLAEPAARLLAAFLADRDEASGRDFRDPGFLAWCLLDWGRATEDRGLQASARRFVDKTFGMKAPPAFASEPSSGDGLFDFSSTSAMRVLAVLAAEGPTPFVGAWLRERVAALAPKAFVERKLDENTWNACVAAALGQAYIVSTDERFLEAHTTIVEELAHRSNETDGGLGRAPGFPAETNATFYYALTLEALIKGSP